MIKKLRILIASVMLACGFVAMSVAPVNAGPAGDAANDVCAGIQVGGGNCGNNDTEVDGLVKTIVNIISAIAGVAAVIMIIISGFKYITSGGDSSKVASAKGALIYAIVGLVIVAFAQIIVRFVIKSAM